MKAYYVCYTSKLFESKLPYKLGPFETMNDTELKIHDLKTNYPSIDILFIEEMNIDDYNPESIQYSTVLFPCDDLGSPVEV